MELADSPSLDDLTESQEQILDAAMRCISRDGIDQFNLRAVAAEAGVSLGLLGYHFTDKQSLVTATFQLATDRLLATSIAAASNAADANARVDHFIRGAYRDEFLEPGYLTLRLSLWAMARTDHAIAAAEASLYVRYAERMEELIALARPDLDPTEVAHRVTDVIVTQNGLWLNWARYRKADDLERGLQRCVRLALGD